MEFEVISLANYHSAGSLNGAVILAIITPTFNEQEGRADTRLRNNTK